jgi:hypothetical protein
VECLVVDPAFAGTRIGDQLQQLAKIQGFTLDWHHGFELEVEEIPADFRGPLMRPLAERICPSGRLNVATVGAAARQVLQQPEAWEDWGDPDSILQQLKQLWHVLVYCGRPLDLPGEMKGEAATAPETR